MSFFGAKNFLIEVAKGNIPGHRIDIVTGNSTAVGPLNEDIWDAGQLDSILYDAQTGNFTPGLVVTGADSGAVATIVIDDDDGATGELLFRDLFGLFEDDEIITDTSTGSATVNGTATGISRILQYPAAGEQLEICSENINDDVAGTGARTVDIVYLDENFVRQATSVDTGGHTPSALPVSDFMRLVSMTVSSWGSATDLAFEKANAGAIVLRSSASKAIRAMIPFDDSEEADKHGSNGARNGHYSVRAGEQALLLSVLVNTSKNHEADTFGMFRSFGNEGFLPLAERFVYQGSVDSIFPYAPAPFEEKTDIRFITRSDNTKVPVNLVLFFLALEVSE